MILILIIVNIILSVTTLLITIKSNLNARQSKDDLRYYNNKSMIVYKPVNIETFVKQKLAEGKSQKEIGIELNISLRQVQRYVQKINKTAL